MDHPYRAHTSEDLLNLLPTLFGFVPYESVIGLSVSGPRCRFGFRLRHDLPEPGDEADLASDLADHLRRHGDGGAFVVALSSDAERARVMALALRDALPPGHGRLTLWADDERLWTDEPGHPVEGEPWSLSDVHESRLVAITRGEVILPDRSALLDEVAAPEGERARLLERLQHETLERLMLRATTTDPEAFLAGERAAVADLVDRGLREHLDEAALVELAVRAAPTHVRDDCWWRIDRGNGRRMHALWAAVSRVAGDDVAPSALCLAAFAAWQWGDGARARVAVDRALQIDPHHRMALLLARALDVGLHPDAWSSTRRPA